MLQAFRDLDRVLRGDATTAQAVRTGELDLPGRRLLATAVLLASAYGVCVGGYALARVYFGIEDTVAESYDGWMQVLASAVKMPLLFLLTLLITLPSLYVFSTLLGSRLTLRSMLRLLLAMTAVTTAVAASLGPIVLFFSLSTESYPFMKLLNVVCCGIAGVIGLLFLKRTLDKLLEAAAALSEPEPDPDPDPKPEPEPEPQPQPQPKSDAEAAAPVPATPQLAEPQPVLKSDAEPPSGDAAAATTFGLSPHWDRPARRRPPGSAVFNAWLVLFALVGAQMSWVLRPFIGDPDLPFAWFRDRDSNFFIDVLVALARLLSGGA